MHKASTNTRLDLCRGLPQHQKSTSDLRLYFSGREHLPRMYETLSSIPSPSRRQRKKEEPAYEEAEY